MRKARWLFVSSAVIFYLLSTPLLLTLLFWPLEKEFRKYQKIDFKPDAVVVLGGGANAYAPDSKLRSSSYKRFMHGMALAKKMNLPLVFAGGGWVERDGITEAAAAIETSNVVADSYGFARPLTNSLHGGFGLVVDDKSENTLQNAQNIFAIMKQNAIETPRIVLVTSAFHMKRAKIIFEKNGFMVTPYAVEFKTRRFEVKYLDFMPNFWALQNNFLALKEYIGIVKFFFVDNNGERK